MTPAEYKEFKALANPSDHMTDLEIDVADQAS
jgi:hypothetical protein